MAKKVMKELMFGENLYFFDESPLISGEKVACTEPYNPLMRAVPIDEVPVGTLIWASNDRGPIWKHDEENDIYTGVVIAWPGKNNMMPTPAITVKLSSYGAVCAFAAISMKEHMMLCETLNNVLIGGLFNLLNNNIANEISQEAIQSIKDELMQGFMGDLFRDFEDGKGN